MTDIDITGVSRAKRPVINLLSMEPETVIHANIDPPDPRWSVEWSKKGEGFSIRPDGLECAVAPIQFDGDRSSGTIECKVEMPGVEGLSSSSSCSVEVLRQPTAIQLTAPGAPGGYMVTVVQSAESYSRLWKLDAGDVYQGDVCDESVGWQPLPADGIIDAQAGVLTVVDVDSSHEARRAGSVMLQPSANLACYGPVDGCAAIDPDGALRISGMKSWQTVEWTLPVDEYRGRTLLLSLDDADARMRFGIVVNGVIGSNYVDGTTRTRTVTVPGEASGISLRVQDVDLDHEGVLHLGVWADAEGRPAWTPGIIVRGG